jgi:lipoyl-dependent peroxiredoxin
MPTRTANAVWNGSLEEGNGTMRMRSGAYEGPYTFQSRFKEGEGTNPEELIAAAHAGCFSMALSGGLGRAGYTPDYIETSARVHIERGGEGFAITRIELTTKGSVPGIDEGTFQKEADAAKAGCPVSKALAGVDISVDAQLV